MTAGGLAFGPELAGQVLAAIAGLVVAVGAAIAAIGERRVPGAILVAGAGIPLVSAPLLARLALRANAGDLAGARLALHTAGAIRVLAGVEVAGIAGSCSLLLAVAGGRSRPLSAGPAAAVAAVAVAAGGVVLAGGIVHQDAVFAGARGAADLFVGLGAAMVALGWRSSPATASAAPVAAALGFSAMEGSLRGLASILMVPQVERLAPQFRTEAIARFLEVPDRELPYQLAGLGLWTAASLVAAGVAARSTRTAAPLVALGWLIAAWAALFLGFPGASDLGVLASAAPGR